MSDRAARIREIVQEARRATGASRPRPPGLAERLDPERVATQLGGRVVENRAGHCVVIERLYQAGQRYGAGYLSDYVVHDEAALRLLSGADDAPPGADAGRTDRVVFVDLETTGLSGGAGSCAFLVGCGSFLDDGFQTRQFFLTGFPQEPALLDEVFGCLGQAGSIVTFNGKSFDVPMIENRWAFHRMAASLEDVHHLDMLHPARRLWRRPAPARAVDAPSTAGLAQATEPREGCSLQALEQALLGVTRTEDPDGWAIPSIYFDFVRSGEPDRLEPVLEHNRLDLISLAGLTARAIRLVRHGPPEAATARECLGLGRIYERSGHHDRAMRCFGEAAGLSGDLELQAGPAARLVENVEVDVRCDALRRLARALRRRRRFAEAAIVWQRLVEAESPHPAARLEALEALAVHHEHRTRQLEAAKQLAAQALAARHEPARRRLRHRLARLDRKLGRDAPPAVTRLPLGSTAARGPRR